MTLQDMTQSGAKAPQASPHVPILLINLDRSTGRLSQMAERLGAVGLAFERVTAIDGKMLSPEEKRAVNPPRARFTFIDTEIACYLSHLKAIQLVVERGLRRAIILEDDAILEADFAVWAEQQSPLPADCDILKLEGFGAANSIKIPLFRHANRSVQFAYRVTGGAAAYLVTLEGAHKLQTALKTMKGQADTDLFAYWRSGLAVYEVWPFPACQDGSGSTIRHVDAPRPRKVRAARYIMKSADKARRLWFVWRKFGLTPILKSRIVRSKPRLS